MADRSNYVNNAPMGLRDHLADETEYSHMVWLTGGSVNLFDVDIQIGAVEIKDHDSATRLDVETVTAKNALFDQSEDGAHVAIGATSDVVVAAGAAGSVSAKLRRLTSDAATLSVVGGGTEATAQRVTIANDSTGVVSVDDNAGSLTVDNAVLSVVGGGAEATAQRVTIANDSTGVLSVDDNGGSLTVDGTVTVSSGSVDVLSLPADTFVAEGGALGKGVLIQGDDGTDRHNLQTDASGYLKTIAQANNGVDIGDVDIATIAAGETHIGEVHTNSAQVDVTPTITAGAYSIGDVIGGIQTLTNAARVSDQATTLDTLVISDKAMQDADLKIWFFNQNPSSGSYDDNDALDIDDTDLGYWIGTLRILSSDYDDAADNSGATLRNIGLKLTPSGSANLFAIAEIETADTYASTSDLTFKYSFDR